MPDSRIAAINSVVPTGRKINGSEKFMALFRRRAPAPARDCYCCMIALESRGPLLLIMVYWLPPLRRFW
jgi:hypothetical protein